MVGAPVPAIPASHPSYPAIAHVLMLLGIADNPVMFPRISYDIDEAQRQAIIAALKVELQVLFDLIPYTPFLYDKG